MENQLDSILVFATNIQTESDKQKISTILDNNPNILQWNIDQEDVDCVLRVVSQTVTEEEVIEILDKHNYTCTPLD